MSNLCNGNWAIAEDYIDTLGEVWTDLEHLKERCAMYNCDELTQKIFELQKTVSKYRDDLADEWSRLDDEMHDYETEMFGTNYHGNGYKGL